MAGFLVDFSRSWELIMIVGLPAVTLDASFEHLEGLERGFESHVERHTDRPERRSALRN